MNDRFIGYCCREWILSVYGLMGRGGRCGLCGEHPKYLREYDPETDGKAPA